MSECWEDDEEKVRALLAKHGYDPDLPPRGRTGPPGEVTDGLHERLRNWVCLLDGVIIDGHADPDNMDICIYCGTELS